MSALMFVISGVLCAGFTYLATGHNAAATIAVGGGLAAIAFATVAIMEKIENK